MLDSEQIVPVGGNGDKLCYKISSSLSTLSSVSMIGFRLLVHAALLYIARRIRGMKVSSFPCGGMAIIEFVDKKAHVGSW